MSRQRGIMVYPMPEPVSGPYEAYALLIREDGQVRMVHSEGVAYSVTAERPWRWNDYSDKCPVFTAHELINFAFYSPPVDLADWIRAFGARLESNFHQIVRWNSEAPAYATLSDDPQTREWQQWQDEENYRAAQEQAWEERTERGNR